MKKIEKSQVIDKIVLCDSINFIKKFPKNSIHAIISDIPYGIGIENWDVLHNNSNKAYGGTSPSQRNAGNIFKRRGKPLNGWSEADKKIPKEYQEWCSLWSSNWFRILKPGGSCIIFAGRRYAHGCIIAMEDNGFTFKDMISWEKSNAQFRSQKLSSIYKRRKDSVNEKKWKDWRLANLRPIFEPILWFQKPYKLGSTLADNVLTYNVGAWNEKALLKYNIQDKVKIYSNIIKVKTTHHDYGMHIAQKPLNLMKLLVSLVTLEKQIVLDPFCGSGTTCIAAKKLNRHFIGLDFDKKSVLLSNKRLKSTKVK